MATRTKSTESLGYGIYVKYNSSNIRSIETLYSLDGNKKDIGTLEECRHVLQSIKKSNYDTVCIVKVERIK